MSVEVTVPSTPEILSHVIHARRTIHKYTKDPVPNEVIDLAIEAAHAAPCHKLTWPWRFSVVGPKTREKIVELGIALKSEGKEISDDKRAAVVAQFGNPGALLIVRQVRSDDPVRAKEDYAAVACALQNMMLTLTAAGYGSKWSTGKLSQQPEIFTLANIDPAREDIVGFMWIGIPSQVPTIERPPVESVVERLP